MRRLGLLVVLFLSLWCLDVTFQGFMLSSEAQGNSGLLLADGFATNQASTNGLPGSASAGASGRIELSPSPRIQPATRPLRERTTDSPLSVDSPSGNLDYMNYAPYNMYPRELDLWRLEAAKFIRSDAVVSPNKDAMVYTEVTFMPNSRQTMARLYWVPIPPIAQPQERLPSEEVLSPAPPRPTPEEYAARFDPNKTLKLRKSLVSVGFDRVTPYEFRTLTIVDWSATGAKLLFKQRSGVNHVGLRTSDILVYDEGRGTITIYPEVHRVIKHYWMNQGNLQNMERLAWDIQPLGWEPNSDNIILLKAWAYDKKEKKYLGLWQYDVDAERTQLLSTENAPSPVAANGYLASPAPLPKKARTAASKKGSI